MAGFSTVADGKFVLRRRNTERADHHRSQRICEFALEHGALASHNPMMFRNFIGQKGREDIGQANLRCIFEITFRPLKVEGHRGEVDAFGTKYMANLTQHFVDPNIRTHIPCSVVPGKKQLQLFSGLPGLSFPQHPSGLGAFNVGANPRFQKNVHHAAVPPRAAGHGW